MSPARKVSSKLVGREYERYPPVASTGSLGWFSRHEAGPFMRGKLGELRVRTESEAIVQVEEAGPESHCCPVEDLLLLAVRITMGCCVTVRLQ